MSTVKLRNINPVGHVDVPLLGRQGEPFGEHGTGCIEPGEVFEVPPEIAGRPPKLAKDGSVAIDEATGQPVDPGEGLLAQIGNYELADKPTRKATPGRRPAKKTTAAKKTEPSPPTAIPPVSPVARADNGVDHKEVGQ